jgi:hypothetical protein
MVDSGEAFAVTAKKTAAYFDLFGNCRSYGALIG